jgi:flavin-dependent thymidylate synthase
MFGSVDNTVELVGYYGGDQTHALSAWTSTSRNLTPEKRARIDKLLDDLAKNEHGSPFEKSYLHFLVDVETASHIHILKHRIGVSVNGESARYKEHTQDKWYLPADWPEAAQAALDAYTREGFMHYHAMLEVLEKEGFSRKRAKESARFFLPYSSQVTLDVGFNFRSFMHFQDLRNDDHAQVEIHEIAQKMLDLVWETGAFDLSLQGFGYSRNG